MDELRVLSFDCYGTLIDWETGILAELVPWSERHGLDVQPEELLGAFGATETGVQAEHPAMRYPDVLGEVLARIGARYDVETSPDERASFGASVPRWPAFADSADSLARLHERFALVILSNVDRASFAASAERLATTFDRVVTAEDVGSYKPDPANFAALLDAIDAMGSRPDQLLHVAESLYHDHEPAMAAGLTTAWIHRRHDRSGTGATAPPRDADLRPRRRYTSMAELADDLTR